MAALQDQLIDQVAERAAGRGVLLVGIAGAVAVGKSTLARTIADGLQARGLAAQAVATDGFLRPNKELEAAGLNARKGFPETFDVVAFHGFLDRLAAGRPARMPVYSHVSYDIVPGETRTVAAKGVVIVEGVNVLQTAQARERFGLRLYVDAEPGHIKAWYLARLDGIIANEPESLIAQISDVAYRKTLIEAAWTGINLVNLRDHIAPTMAHADVVVRKAADHSLVALVALVAR
ncbi:MAG: hypothetical protein JNL41_04285 [Phenylobacterium sp.]|uniref:type I pantothenate kinase n=1 Tax=Phenylobacterium sp. TaxID=1871053 RepID=UPI001A5364ED|nr:hypothetical protein [Phenylobacterium sp.]MBL8553473.1 hypothetical protein [Phenylobacterium sp.]